MLNLKSVVVSALLFATVLAVPVAEATGLATCDSGDPAGWQKPEALQSQLEDKGWKVNRIKEDGGCYEVYAIDGDGERVEAYFHPVTLEPVPMEDDD